MQYQMLKELIEMRYQSMSHHHSMAKYRLRTLYEQCPTEIVYIFIIKCKDGIELAFAYENQFYMNAIQDIS